MYVSKLFRAYTATVYFGCCPIKDHNFLGSKGRTNYVRLNKRLHNDFERGQNDTYRITAFDVGEIYCVELSANVGWKFVHRNPDWFVDNVRQFNLTLFI